jgi:hypothetical protein
MERPNVIAASERDVSLASIGHCPSGVQSHDSVEPGIDLIYSRQERADKFDG